jgi:O-acetylhomoserine/O-acetylserine sulfhydrylase-like pyridoxal-dependent enzyme
VTIPGPRTTMGGILVDPERSAGQRNFPQMTEASRGYHGVRFTRRSATSASR